MNTPNNARKGRLTERQARFAEEFLACGNACEAARRAGMVNEYAVIARKQPAVQQYLDELRPQLYGDAIENARAAMAYLRGVMENESARKADRWNAANKLVKQLVAILGERGEGEMMTQSEYLAKIQTERERVWMMIRKIKQSMAQGLISEKEMMVKVEFGEALLDMLDEMEKEGKHGV